MAGELLRKSEYLGQSFESWKTILDSLEAMVAACLSITSSPNNDLKHLLDEWKTLLLLQRVRLEEQYESSMQSCSNLGDTAPLGLQLESLKWPKLLEVFKQSCLVEEASKPSTASRSTSPCISRKSSSDMVVIPNEDDEEVVVSRMTAEDFVVCVEKPLKQSASTAKEDSEFDGDLCETPETDEEEWASNLSGISNFEHDAVKVKVEPEPAPVQTRDCSTQKPVMRLSPSEHDLKYVRDRIMARFQLYQRFGHHLSRDVVTEVMRRAVERDAMFVNRPLPHIYETVKVFLPIALESAKSKYQAPQVNSKLLTEWTYKTKLCLPFSVNAGRCPNGENCPYAHGEMELRPKRRIALCHQWEERGFCPRRTICFYAHGREELGKEVQAR